MKKFAIKKNTRYFKYNKYSKSLSSKINQIQVNILQYITNRKAVLQFRKKFKKTLLRFDCRIGNKSKTKYQVRSYN